ncbi:MAG: D-aminoacyl-tRNA deacylase [Candidatus Izemoplasmataceae bacterium]
MKIILQRVKEASCKVNEEVISTIEHGYLLLVGFKKGDTEQEALFLAKKVAKLRIYEDDQGKLNHDILFQKNHQILSISQFTIYGDTKKGNRPSFTEAMVPDEANALYTKFNQALREYGLIVKEGKFQHHMDISLINDGPVTIILEKD